MKLRAAVLCSIVAFVAIPSFALPDEELQYNYYDSSGTIVGGFHVSCSGPPFTSGWGQTTDYFTLEIQSICQIGDPVPDCSDFATESTNCANYCVSSEYRVQVEIAEITDPCVD